MFRCRQRSTDEWVALPVNPSAGELSRTASFSPSGLEDLRVVEHILQQDNGEEEALRVLNCCTLRLLQAQPVATYLLEHY